MQKLCVDLRAVTEQLNAVEAEIESRLLAPKEASTGQLELVRELQGLKASVDRLRPLLWIQLRRLGAGPSEPDDHAPAPPPAELAQIMASAGLEPMDLPLRLRAQEE